MSYCNPVLFSSKANSGGEQENRSFYRAMTLHAYRVAISIIAPPLAPHLFLPGITIITNNYRDIPPRFVQAVTTAVGHARECYMQFKYSCKQLYHVEKFFKINIGPKELNFSHIPTNLHYHHCFLFHPT